MEETVWGLQLEAKEMGKRLRQKNKKQSKWLQIIQIETTIACKKHSPCAIADESHDSSRAESDNESARPNKIR